MRPLSLLDAVLHKSQLDVWGLGIVLFGMVFGYAPFGESPADDSAFDKLCVSFACHYPPRVPVNAG
jgi:serine/threonine protein kinase